MSPASGEFFAPGRPDHKFGLETLGCESGRIRRQVRPTERGARRLVEKETADATGDRTDFERTVEHSADRKLPVVPSMKFHRDVTQQIFWGAHAPSRAETFSRMVKAGDCEGAI